MDDNYIKKVTTARILHERARYLRGRFLNSVAVIERNIAVMLTQYFCEENDEKRALFFTKVAENLSLQRKKDILIEIIKKEHPCYWEKHQHFLQELRNIQEFRNKLAHSIVDVSDDALERPIEYGVGFVQWQNGVPITDSEFENWEVRLNMLNSTLSDIKHLLPYKEIPIN